MTPYLFKAGLAAALCSLLAATAHADSAEAAVRDLRFQLVDLDPNDGIAPSFTFQNLAGGGNIVGATSSNTIIDHEPDWTSTNYRLHEGSTEALASYSITPGNYLAWISAARPFDGSISPEVVFMDGQPGSVVLSAKTRLIVSGTATARVTGDGSAVAGYQFGRDGYSVIRQFASLIDIHSGGQVFEHTVDLAGAYDNEDSTSVNLSFRVHARSSLTASAVPEPGTWGLGLVGLMVVGASRRGASRRREAPTQAS